MRSPWFVLLMCGIASAAPDPAPGPEVVASDVKVDVPAPPRFEIPAVVDGVHGVRELRLAGKKLLGTDVKVAGYVVSTTGTRLFLGETKDAPIDQVVQVVEVTGLKLVAGEYVVVSGKFGTSAGGLFEDAGLVKFASATRPAAPIKQVMEPVSDGDVPAPPVLKPRARKATTVKQQNESADHLNTGNKLAASGDLDGAAAAYTRALAAWPDNHLAAYGLGGIYAARSNFAEASKAFLEAATIRPDVALYWQWVGVTEYELQTRGDAPVYDAAALALTRATTLAPKSWRAHYYLGKIARSRTQLSRASTELGLAIVSNPAEGGPYLALADLERKWDGLDQAISVATQGLANAPKTKDLWFVLGLAYERKNDPDKAIAAFDHLVDSVPLALFERGRMELAKHDTAAAKRDLTAYAGSGDKNRSQQELAGQLLKQIK